MRVSTALAGILGAAAAAAAIAAAADPRVVGWVETVKLGAEGITIAAKLDTGADTSSLHAVDLRWFSREDGDWVGFDVVGEKGERAHFERKVVRTARIKRARGESQRRPTVLLGICLANVYRVAEINLVDRGHLNYELLVGRSFLHSHFAVDSARTHTVEPRCEVPKAQ